MFSALKEYRICTRSDFPKTAACQKNYLEWIVGICDNAFEGCEALYNGLDVDLFYPLGGDFKPEKLFSCGMLIMAS